MRLELETMNVLRLTDSEVRNLGSIIGRIPSAQVTGELKEFYKEIRSMVDVLDGV